MSITSDSATISTPMRWHGLSRCTIVGIAVLLGHAPMVVHHLRALWQKEYYQFFPFVIAAVFWLVWSRWQEATPVPGAEKQNQVVPVLLLAGSLALLTISILLISGWLAMVSLNVALGAFFWRMGYVHGVPKLAGVWCLLWLLVPMPLTVDERLIRYLQVVSSKLSSTVMDLLGINHLMAGNVLEFPTKRLFVDEACSGIVSVMSMVAVAMIYGVWQKRGLVHVVLLVVLSLLWAVLMNSVRITVIAAFHHWFGTDLSSGAIHEMLGLVIFLVMFGALLSTDHLLQGVLTPPNMNQLEDTWANNRLVWLWNRILGDRNARVNIRSSTQWRDTQEIMAGSESAGKASSVRLISAMAVAIPFLFLGLVQLLWLPSVNTEEAKQAINYAISIEQELLPQTIGHWKRFSFESIERDSDSPLGRYSKMYRYRHMEQNGLEAVVSLDFAYLGGWHDLCYCYTGQGWKTRERAIHAENLSNGEQWKYVLADLEKEDGAKAMLIFAGFDVSGAYAEPPSNLILFRPWLTLRRRLLRHTVPQLLQVQLFTPTPTDGDANARTELQDLLFGVRERFRNAVMEYGNDTSLVP